MTCALLVSPLALLLQYNNISQANESRTMHLGYMMNTTSLNGTSEIIPVPPFFCRWSKMFSSSDSKLHSAHSIRGSSRKNSVTRQMCAWKKWGSKWHVIRTMRSICLEELHTSKAYERGLYVSIKPDNIFMLMLQSSFVGFCSQSRR